LGAPGIEWDIKIRGSSEWRDICSKRMRYLVCLVVPIPRIHRRYIAGIYRAHHQSAGDVRFSTVEQGKGRADHLISIGTGRVSVILARSQSKRSFDMAQPLYKISEHPSSHGKLPVCCSSECDREVTLRHMLRILTKGLPQS
jgi:hypothetical protein